MKKIAYIISFLLAVVLVQPIWSQSTKITVTGTISDNIGPLPGATVPEKGNPANGSVTGMDGKFQISVKPNATIVVQCLGYSQTEVEVKGKEKIDIVLKESAEQLAAAEVVSVGYGSVARRDLTGSVAKVNLGDIVKSTPMNFDQALAGRVAGVVVTTADGQVGAEATITIRGNNSLTQSSAPLYVIDGFPTESSFASSISPYDIESIDVLKDASATAIYGARGANGVIVITTKRGAEGKPKVNFSASATLGKIANKVDILNGYEYVRLTDEYTKNVNGPNTYSSYFTGFNPDGTFDYNHYSLKDYESVPYVDWQDKVYKTSVTQNYNVSVSGGSRSAGNIYNVSFSVLDDAGILTNSRFRRYSGKFNFTQDFGKKVSVDINANYSRSITDGTKPSASEQSTTQSSYLLYQIWGFRPLKPLRFGLVDDSFIQDLVDTEVSNPENFRFNPLANVKNQYRKITNDYIVANIALNYRIVEGLKLRISGGYNYSKNEDGSFNSSKTMTGHPAFPLGYGPNGQILYSQATSWLNENTLTYDATFGRDHHFQALIGATFQGETSTYQGVGAHQIASEELGLEGMNTGVYQAIEPHRWEWTMASALARINYNYQHKYYLTASFRADGSSKFPASNRWGYFPSASLAWSFANEDFIKNLGFISTGKLRASWGRTGNNRTTTPYDYYARFLSQPGSNNNVDYVRDGKTVSGYSRGNMANDNLKWETTEQIDLGLDLGFFQDRISLTADLYQKNTYDLLLQATMPSSSGFTSAMVNIGSMRNRGLEFTLTAVPFRKRNFTWTSTFNIGINRNTVTGLSMNQTTLVSSVNWHNSYTSQTPYVTKVGMPTGLMYGFRYLGTYKADEFANGTNLKEGIPYLESLGRTTIRPGDPKYEDVNGDGVINDSDRTVIGIGQPLHSGGFTNTFNFYGFDVSVFFNWSYGNNILNANRLVFENYNGTELNQFGTMRNAYSVDRNPDSDVPRAGARGMDYYSSRVVEDGSFLRLKTLTVGYTIPQKNPDAVITGVRFYLTGNNLWTLTNYSGPDPEVSTRNSVLTPGFDWSAYPRARSLTLGVSLNFR